MPAPRKHVKRHVQLFSRILTAVKFSGVLALRTQRVHNLRVSISMRGGAMDNDEWARTPKAFQNLGNELTPEDKRHIAAVKAGMTAVEASQFKWAEYCRQAGLMPEAAARNPLCGGVARSPEWQPPGYKPFDFELEWQAAKQRLADAFAVPPEVLRGHAGVGMSNPHIVAPVRTGLPLVALRKLCPSPQPEYEVGFGSEPPAKPAPKTLPKGATRHPAIGAQCFALPDSRAFMLGRNV